MVERFRLIDGGNTLEVAFTVEDPARSTSRVGYPQPPPLGQPSLRPVEFDCSAANDDYFNIGLEPVPTAEKTKF